MIDLNTVEITRQLTRIADSLEINTHLLNKLNPEFREKTIKEERDLNINNLLSKLMLELGKERTDVFLDSLTDSEIRFMINNPELIQQDLFK